MKWNWQNTGWPNFRYDTASLITLEQKFLQSAGEVIGAVRHFNEDDSKQLRIELLSDEAVKTGDRRDDGGCLSKLAWVAAS